MRLVSLSVICVLLATACAREARRPEQKEAEPTTRAARNLQEMVPIEQIDLALDAFHVMKDNPDHQMEAVHYCARLDPEVTQCVLYDKAGPQARLVGVEYVVSEAMFDEMPEAEKKFWHPHNYEILSGQLVAPGVTGKKDAELMSGLLNTYGKTWHLWDTGGMGSAKDPLPYGTPELAWSFNADGEAPVALIQARDRRLDIDTEAVRRSREGLARRAHAQEGVDALEHAFPNRRLIPGVRERTPVTRSRPATR